MTVTTDFAVFDPLTIADLSFTSFSAGSSADNLELETDNLGSIAAVDDKTITIIGSPSNYRSIGTNSAILYQTGTASITRSTSFRSSRLVVKERFAMAASICSCVVLPRSTPRFRP